MKNLSRSLVPNKLRTVKILQFGEGNFLRAFVDWIIQIMNIRGVMDANVVVVQPMVAGRLKDLAAQDGLFTLYLQGINNGQIIRQYQLIDVISEFNNPFTEYKAYLDLAHRRELEFVVSNTTEAGISLDSSDLDFTQTPKSYPGKLLAFLKERFDFFKGDYQVGLEILPCELIDDNGHELRRVMIDLAHLKGYSSDFLDWLNGANHFHSTLVDRIVPGYPRDEIDSMEQELGYHDTNVVKSELFHLWVIEGNAEFEKKFPAQECGLNVIITPNIKPYKERKVKILNGAHTALVPVAYLMGIDTVREAMENPAIHRLVALFWKNEVLPTIDLPSEEINQFAGRVSERFLNPFIRHELLSIALNATTKYATRIFPVVKEYHRIKGTWPRLAIFALAAAAVFYRGQREDGTPIKLADSPEYLAFWSSAWSLVDGSLPSCLRLAQTIFSRSELFGPTMAQENDVVDMLGQTIFSIVRQGMKQALAKELSLHE